MRKSQKAGNDEVRSIALKGLGLVVTKTPFDEGTAKGNWNVAIDSINESTDLDRKESEALFAGDSVIGSYNDDNEINISNALPYANRLENGWSAQAPNGMVKVTIAELNRIILRNNKKI
jgi:lysophospholipase L1-like esterase